MGPVFKKRLMLGGGEAYFTAGSSLYFVSNTSEHLPYLCPEVGHGQKFTFQELAALWGTQLNYNEGWLSCEFDQEL